MSKHYNIQCDVTLKVRKHQSWHFKTTVAVPRDFLSLWRVCQYTARLEQCQTVSCRTKALISDFEVAMHLLRTEHVQPPYLTAQHVFSL